MGRARPLWLWTPRFSTVDMATSPFMEVDSSEGGDSDYYEWEDLDYEVPENSHSVCEWVEATSAQSDDGVTQAILVSEAEESTAEIASVSLSSSLVPMQEGRQVTMETVMAIAPLFVLEVCRTKLKNWIDSFLDQLECLRMRVCRALRALLRKPLVWAMRRRGR